ncbi:MAG: peptidase S41 [Marinilabiliaceae bacterium]|nr:peptidase S41 [Marinilabiliaceae bacterium]
MISVLLISISCEKDSSIYNENVFISDSTKNVNKFIYNTMMTYYYWNDQIPDINPNTQPDSEDFFYSLLNDKLDQWSFITDDYQGLINYFNGVQLSMGMSFQLYYLDTISNNLIGVVEYVDKDGPADLAGITRGNIFYAVNNVELNDQNYYDLLNRDSYILTFGEFTETGIIELSPSINLSAVELTVNPIHMSKILNINGKMVAYLALNAFQANNETELKNLFADFKSHNVTELVLDLRYNGGGTVTTANLIASMIGPSSIANNIMIKTSYNTILTSAFKAKYPDDESIFIYRFITSSSNLNLSRLFVLTSSSTASASEMVIYSLEPYMNVIQIGEETHGKYYGSRTFNDTQNESYWAIQPIISKSENADNSIDYSKGLPPDYFMFDDYKHDLGDINENLLATAISIIDAGYYNSETLKKIELQKQQMQFKLLKNNKLKKYRELEFDHVKLPIINE